MLTASVVLVRPYNPANLGSVARVVKNFGIRQLSVVEPAVAADAESVRLASGADDVLARISPFSTLSDALADARVVVTTSSLRGRGKTRSIELAELAPYLADAGEGPVAFVFGPERSGLTEDELARASACLRLPTDPEFPTMNLSHAVACVLAVAAAFAAPPAAREARQEGELAPASEIEAAITHWDSALEAIDFYDTGHRGRSLRDWRRLVAARPLTAREVAILRGVANRILVSLRRRGLP
jgi:tRNA/rRNA methyltransferase